MMTGTSSTLKLFRLLISLPLAGMLIGCFWPGPWLWGLNHLAYLPLPPWVVALWPLSILLVIWTPLAGRLGGWLVDRVEPFLLGNPWRVYLVVPLIGMGCAWLIRSNTPLLGDGMLVTSMISQGSLFHGFDWVAYHLYATLATGFGITDFLEAFRLLAILSTLTGGAFFTAIVWSTRRLARQPGDAVLVFGLLVLVTPLQLFLGYAECYAQMAVCLLVCGTYLMLYLEGRAPLLRGTLWFAAALFWHLNALFVAPMVLVIACWPTASTTSLLKRCWQLVWPPLAAVILALALQFSTGHTPTDLVESLTESQGGRPLFNNLTGPRGMLDFHLWKDLLNLVLLLVPMSAALLLSLPFNLRQTTDRVLLVGPLWLLLLAATLHLKLGFVRDWDLLAGASVMVSLVAFTTWQRRAPDPRPTAMLAGFVMVAGLGLAAPWFAFNASGTATLERLPSATIDLPPYHRALALEDLGRWYREHDDLDQALVSYRQASRACPQHPRFHLLCGQVESQRGRNIEAIASLRRALQLDPDLGMARKTLLQCLMTEERYQEALPHARLLAGTDLDDASVSASHGFLAELADHPEEAVDAYVRAIQFDGSRLDLMTQVGALELSSGRLDRAEYAFRKVLSHDRDWTQARLGLAQTLWEQSQVEEGDQRHRYREILTLLEGLSGPQVDPATLAAWRANLQALLEP